METEYQPNPKMYTPREEIAREVWKERQYENLEKIFRGLDEWALNSRGSKL